MAVLVAAPGVGGLDGVMFIEHAGINVFNRFHAYIIAWDARAEKGAKWG